MTRRGRKHLLKPLVLLVAALALEGCISPQADSVGRYTSPIGGSPVISNETPYSAALRCMSGMVTQHPVRIAVGQIADYTGKTESDGSGRKVTAGAALMAMSALSKAGVHMVERFDTSVAEMELKYANNKLIADDKNPNAGDFRKIMAGSIPGSDYYIVGGITELNFNIRSENANGNGGGTASNATTGTASGSLYVMNVGLDLRLVNTNTLEVADVISYQKQIIGRQVSAGVFDFLGTNFFDVSAGRKRAGADPAGGSFGDRTRHAGNGEPHLSRPRQCLRLADRHRCRSAGRCAQPHPYYPNAPYPKLSRSPDCLQPGDQQ